MTTVNRGLRATGGFALVGGRSAELLGTAEDHLVEAMSSRAT